MPQTSYSDVVGTGQVGALQDEVGLEVVSRFSAAAIPFGRFVSKASGNDDKVALPSASGDITALGNLQGVAIRTQALQTDPSSSVAQYPAKASINVARSGRVLMYAEQAVGPADPVYVRYTANGATNLPGQVRKDADTARAALMGYGRFVSTAEAGELVVVEFRIP